MYVDDDYDDDDCDDDDCDVDDGDDDRSFIARTVNRAKPKR